MLYVGDKTQAFLDHLDTCKECQETDTDKLCVTALLLLREASEEEIREKFKKEELNNEG